MQQLIFGQLCRLIGFKTSRHILSQRDAETTIYDLRLIFPALSNNYYTRHRRVTISLFLYAYLIG